VIEPWADSGKRLDATLREIAPEADAMTRTYRVRVALDATADTLRLGQTARVYFVGPKAAEQTVIPLTALDQRDGNANVWIVDTHTHQVHAAPVSIATYREQDAVIGKGIGAETWIVTAGVHKLREGQVVAPIDGVNRPVKI
jgi:multidrug efflux system membrane fusion protein